MSPSALPQLMTRKEIAAYLRISLSQLDRLHARGRIPFVDAGRYTRRYNPERVERALTHQEPC